MTIKADLLLNHRFKPRESVVGKFPITLLFFMQAENWILIGMMGAGKSTTGKELAHLSGRPFIETDQLLQNRFGRPVHEIFARYGEEAFRDHEHSILKSIETTHAVISTGGGMVMRNDNWDQFHRLGKTIYLEVPLARLIERVGSSRKRRPLVEVDDWEVRFGELFEKREALYQKADMHFKVEINNSKIVAEQLWEVIQSTPSE